MHFNDLNAMRASSENGIIDGARQTLKRGEGVRFRELPNQPIALVIYNNTGNNPTCVVSYNSMPPKSIEIASVEAQGFSLGFSYLFNPAVTGSREISISLPNDVPENSSVDVYLVSLYLPTYKSINNIRIPLNGEEKSFSGYSRAFATPPLNWHRLNITSEITGLIGLYFKDDTIKLIGVNVPAGAETTLKQKVFHSKNTGVESYDLEIRTGSSYQEDFFGTSTQLVYSPVSSAKTTNAGRISIQPF